MSIHAVCEIDDVVEAFEKAAHARGDATAILHNGAVITYQFLAQRIARIADRYRRACADGDSSDPLGVEVSHHPATVEHLLGALRAGGAYCPIDTALPVARRRALVEAFTAGVIDSSAAYVLCTSGSTGAPKPVVVSRAALSVTVRALAELFELTPADRVLQFASLSWDTCFEEILPALTSGATVVFDCEAHCGSMPRFLRMVEQRRITVLDLPTAFWHELVRYLHEEPVSLPGSLRLVIIGGERVDPTRLQQWRALAPHRVGLLNTYGCTETTMVTHAVKLAGVGTEPDVAGREDAAPLGRALPHVDEHITDEGELLVAGPALATGYLGAQDLTAAAFPVADHGTGPVRWFRTGDLVSRDANGLLHPRGRVDEQLKVLGVRVHPAEVEAHLNRHPAVAGAVVVGVDVLGRTTLTAYVVPALAVTAAVLKRHLRERLPSQFVPSRIDFVAELSYTASGKVDRAGTHRAAAQLESKGAGQ